MANIHRLVLRRLLLAWLVISLLLGGVIHQIEVKRMEKTIVAMANAKMQELTLGDLLDLPPGKNSQDELHLRSASFLEKNFILIEVFTADGQRVARFHLHQGRRTLLDLLGALGGGHDDGVGAAHALHQLFNRELSHCTPPWA